MEYSSGRKKMIQKGSTIMQEGIRNGKNGCNSKGILTVYNNGNIL